VRGTRAADWITSGLILVAIGVALGALNSVLAGVMWWFASCGIAAAVLIAAAIVRSLARNPLWGTLAAFLAGVFSITLLFAPESAILGFIPTVDTIAALRVLEQAGYSSIANQGIPADAVQGILYLICLGVAAIALAMDTFAFTFKTRALTGIPLLVLLLVPSFVVTSINDALYFALTAFAWLAILVVPTRATDRRAALAVAGISVVLALVIPAALPPTRSDAADGANGPAAVVTGVNPIITLGKDLRQGSKTLALTYTTTEPGGEYLRLATLDDFNGASWLPAVDAPTPGNDVAKIGPVPGLGAGIRVTDVTSDITVASILTRWLPVPYAARSITGLQGNWGWEPAGLSVSSDISSAQGQKYEVKSVQPTPAVDELNAAGTIVEPGFERYLALPLGLPPVVADRARQVVGNATTNYQKAVALQKYFTGGAFTYSEQAPVQKGYDGSGAAVLAAFLAEKTGIACTSPRLWLPWHEPSVFRRGSWSGSFLALPSRRILRALRPALTPRRCVTRSRRMTCTPGPSCISQESGGFALSRRPAAGSPRRSRCSPSITQTPQTWMSRYHPPRRSPPPPCRHPPPTRTRCLTSRTSRSG
jgi:hypothetical protein